jgi:predicted outer membrane repeat protein
MRYICTPIVVTLVLAGTAFAETHTVFANNTSFSPDAIDVAPGDTIVWQYNSGYPHTVTSGVACTADGLFNGELQNGGDTFTWEVPLDASGDIPYFCEPHCQAGMDGIIAVVGGSNVLNVPADYPAIQGALNAAVNGDTIFIAAGTYNESDLFIEDANIVITGEVNAEGEPLVTIDGGGDSNILIAIGVVGATGATVENIVFTGSTGNALWIYHHNPTIRNCVFTGNVTSTAGGALWSSDTEAIIENCRFVDNDGGNTGSIFFSKATSPGPGPTIRDCVFEGNTAYSTVVIQHCNPVIEQCTFESNTSPDFFGATVRLLQSAATFSDCVFTGNVGSGIGAEQADGLQILDCAFSDNAVAYGGGVRLSGTSGDQATISGCSFMNHVSPVSELGSALNSNSIDLTLVDCEFIGNSADSTVFVASGASYDIDRCHFENNFNGTCASFSSDVDVSMSQCTFIDNSSNGVSIGGFSTASFSECLFENNHATWGGAILTTQTDTIIDSCEFKKNGPVTGFGPGAISNNLGTLIILGSLFCENQGDPNDIDGPWDDGGGNEFNVECPSDCIGDLDGNGEVGVDDILNVLAAYQQNADGDCDGDGDTDVDDLLLLISAWGPCSS